MDCFFVGCAGHVRQLALAAWLCPASPWATAVPEAAVPAPATYSVFVSCVVPFI